jgi:hypothetical protein
MLNQGAINTHVDFQSTYYLRTILLKIQNLNLSVKRSSEILVELVVKIVENRN